MSILVFTRSKVVVWNDPGPIEESWSIVSTHIYILHGIYYTKFSNLWMQEWDIEYACHDLPDIYEGANLEDSNYEMGHFAL